MQEVELHMTYIYEQAILIIWKAGYHGVVFLLALCLSIVEL